MNNKNNDTGSGFTLIEMAVVLAIVALLLGGLLPTISGQIEQQHRRETRKQLEEIQQALLGFAIINGRLPCPIDPLITDPTNATYGQEAASCSTAPTSEGILPWKTLGVSETDSWGTIRSGTTSTWNGYWRYRVDRNFATAITINTPFADTLKIYNNAGTQITSSSEAPLAIVFSTGPDLIANGQNADASFTTYQCDVPGVGFDDILVWISRPQLFNRMVAAGKLP